jgi:hypothetical protein
MSSLLIKNIGTLATEKLESPLRQADSILVKDGRVAAIGNNLNKRRSAEGQACVLRYYFADQMF